MVFPTPYAMTTSLDLGGTDGSRIVLPVVPAHGAAAPEFSPPQTSEERTDIKNEGFPWPGEWTVERDEARQKTTCTGKARTDTSIRGARRMILRVSLTTATTPIPETSSVRGEAESVFALKGRTLVWRGHLSVSTDQKNFYYKYTRELLKDGQMVKTKTWQETIPRDHQ